jgi:hypothetical protein
MINNYQDNGKINYYPINVSDKKSKDNLVLGLYKNHFFLDEKIKVSTYWVKHYNEYKENEKFQSKKNMREIDDEKSMMREKDPSEKTKVGLILE